ncbi:MAG: AAA family ATPase, partial [Candidatus Melainabacteria bacterium]|nr:AAA family ATPase [Candidatus Melainabacteria bacterium]
MASKLKDLPIGVQTFREMIESSFLYVDKTREIYDLVSKPKAAYFLSRPRRFGKSLLVSTLEAIFRNERELFKGLWLDSSDYEWGEYPVIKLDISAVDKNSVEELRDGLKRLLVKIAAKYEIKLENLSPSAMLSDLISELAKKHGSKVVVLVDEYDDPIIKHISNPELALQMRDLLHDFYKIIKSEDANIRFVFLTGVSKFSRTSIFSGLNNLNNISMQEKYASIVGITQEELERDFSPYLDLVAEKNKTTKEGLLEQLKHWYNGYRFSEAEQRVYNPFSTLSFFDTMKFTNFWFATGTPSYLINLIKRDSLALEILSGKIQMPSELLNTYDIQSLPLIPIMFDSGYLTIQDYSIRNDLTTYTLNYPNFEVKNSFNDNLLPAFTEKPTDRVSLEISSIASAILENDLEIFFTLLKSYFAGIPYELIPVKTLNEKYFHLVFYLLMRVTSFRVNIEDRSSSGRVD